MRSEVGVVLPCLQPTPSRCSRWETKRAPAPGAFSSGVNPSRRGRGDLSITEVEGTQKDHRVHLPSSGSSLQDGERAVCQRIQLPAQCWLQGKPELPFPQSPCPPREAPGASRRCHHPSAVPWLLLKEG